MARKFVLKNIKLRLMAILIFAICSFVILNRNSNSESIPARYLVSLQPEPKTIFQNRDLSAYDFGGEIASCFNNVEIPAKDCRRSEKQVREFIYKHWQDKKRAYIILEFNCDSCSEYCVFIEPDKSGYWHIVWRREFSNFERGFSSNISNEEMTSVVYKIAGEDDWLEIGTKILSFLDKDGEEIHLY